MKVILNSDVPNLGELGDVKDVAKGYARNYLLPRGLVYPYTPIYIAMFEKRKTEIAAHKAAKRSSSAELKAKIEAEDMLIEMTAGQNGKLFGAVSSITLADELLKKGIQIDRKKIDIPGRVIKSVGNYKIAVHLYEKEEAELHVSIKGIVEKPKQEPQAEQGRKRRHADKHHEQAAESPVSAEAVSTDEAQPVDSSEPSPQE